jgi:predicted ATPase
LETLGTAAMHDLVLDAAEGRLDRATRSAIAARAAGNPLFAEELVRAALVTSERPAIVPISAADIAIERLERLSARDRTLLTFASVIGMEFSGSFLATMTETEPAAVYASIRTASALGLVEETDDPDVFRFRHGLTRDAVYAELLEIERRAMHRKVFEAMRAMPQPASIGAIAFHAHAAQDAPAAAYFGELAGDNAAANRAAAAACVFYERALAACVPASVGRLSEKLPTARLAAGLPDLAEGPAREALRERLQANDVQGVLDAYVLLADIAAQSGADDARLATFEEMRRFLETIPDPSFEAFRALCESELAFADFDMDRVVAVSAAAAVRGASDAQVAITIANARAHALLARREYRSAIASQTLAVRRADRDGDPNCEPRRT